MPVVGSNSWAMRRGAAIILTTVAKGTTMPNDDLIAALERAAEALRYQAEAVECGSHDFDYAAKLEADAATIRALIADLRAGNLVRREDVVKAARTEALRIEECAYGISDTYRALGMRDFADAIAAGAHDASNKSEPNQ